MEEEQTNSLKTDEEKSLQNGVTETDADGDDAQTKTDDEKLTTDGDEPNATNGENKAQDTPDSAPADDKETSNALDTQETATTDDKKLERQYSTDSFTSALSSSPSAKGDKEHESKADDSKVDPEPAPAMSDTEKDSVKADDPTPAEAAPAEEPTHEDEAVPVETNQNEDENDVTPQPEPESKPEETPAETTPEPVVKVQEEEPAPVKAEEKERVAEGGIDKEDLEGKINDNEELKLKLESSLSNQQAERDAYKKLTEENATLQKHHGDMKEKLEDMQGGHMLLLAEVETLRKVNDDQKETIAKLEGEVKILKETQGGDENIKDMQDKLIRLSNEQEEKDRTIHSLQGELDQTREQLKDAESRAARGGNAEVVKSKTCIVM